MTTIEDVLTYIDGSNANGRLVVAWKPFTVGNVNAAGGELEWPIVDGEVSISLYANTGAQPTGSYYIAKYELENGAVYLEQWVVPNLPTVNLGQVRVSFPPSPSVMISPLQLTSLNAQPGMFLQWDGQRWVPAYPSTFNLDPNWIAITTDSSGNDVGVIGSPVHLGNSVTIHIPDAGLTSRGVVTTSPQSFGGVKTFANTVNISTSIKFALRSVAPVYGELLGFGTGGADTSLSFGGNIIASRVSPVDRPYVRADNFIGSSMDLATFGIVPTAVMPGSLANPARTLAAFLLPVAGTVDWTGIGTDTTGALWLRTGTSTSAGFLYLDTAGNVTAREFRMDPYQHLNAPGVEATRSDATMVMYSGTTDWAGYGVNSTPEIWFRMGPNAAGAYYYFGAGGARFPGNLTVGNIVVTGGVTLPAGTYVPTSRRINTSTGLTGGGPLTADLTLSAVDNTTTQKVETAQAGLVKAVRKRLNFIAGAGQLITVVDDSGNDQANVTITSSTSGSASPSIYSVNGTPVGTQPELNLIAGTNVILSPTLNNTGLSRVDITVNTSGGAAITDPTTAIGDLIIRGTATPSPLTYLHVGATTGYVLTTDLTTAPFIKWADKVPITRQIIAGAGLGGGGALGGIAATDVTLTANVVSVNGQTGAVVLTAANVGGVPTTRQVIAGTGLTGGGPLSNDVTLAVVNDTVTERVRVSNAGALVGTRQQINFIQGSNITLTVADVPGSNWVGVTVAATTSGLADPTTTKGDLIVRPVGPPATRMGVGATDGMVLTVDSTDATFGIKWKVVPLSPQTPWASDIDGAAFTLKNAGAVGIGTLSPISKLDIVEVSRAYTDAGGGFGSMRVGLGPAVTDEALLFGVHAGDYSWIQAIKAGTTVRNLVLNGLGGAVGIGTATPQAACEVNPLARATVFNPGDASTWGDVIIHNRAASGAATGIALGINSLTFTNAYCGMAAVAASASDYDAHLVFISRPPAAGSVERMRITSAGNIGIGTTNPGVLLSTGSSVYAPIKIAVFDLGPGTSTCYGIGVDITGKLTFGASIDAISGTPQMVLTNAGNVGIGTMGPQARLHVLGPSGDTGGTYGSLVVSGGDLAHQIRVGYYLAGDYGWIQCTQDAVGVKPLVLQGVGGNVGIGTTGPQALLHCNGSLLASTIGIGLTSPSPYSLWIREGVNQNVLFTPSSGVASIQATNDAVSVYIPMKYAASLHSFTDGNVSIRGAAGSFALDVAGDVNCSGVFRLAGTQINYPQYAGGSGGAYELGAQADVPGMTITVPYAGRYLILASIQFQCTADSTNLGRAFLYYGGNQHGVYVDYGAGGASGTEHTISCHWHIIATAGMIMKLQAVKIQGASVKIVPANSVLTTMWIAPS